ncbi:hypothetical protein ZIOFF_068129 [Zingiber officinale]|uniref:LysM domain-containing protein n=1 Tax=Zingiber officinale TaxID=94328 RepID=A0A8J5C6M5_ZINOF|nr:hypothetical protein ZIOFF_068129 [Zingiber officinale]
MDKKLLLLFFISFLLAAAATATAKSTIEPCTGGSSCYALLGYTLYADLKVSEVAALFQADPLALLAVNAIDVSLPDVENRILPSGLFVRVPAICSCSGGIRRSISTRYTVRPSDTLASIAASVYAGLVSADQIQEENTISDPAALDAGTPLAVPLPCTCFNSTDNFLPAVYLSYVVQQGDSVPGIASHYATTVTDIMNANSLGSPSIQPGDIISIPLPGELPPMPDLGKFKGRKAYNLFSRALQGRHYNVNYLIEEGPLYHFVLSLAETELEKKRCCRHYNQKVEGKGRPQRSLAKKVHLCYPSHLLPFFKPSPLLRTLRRFEGADDVCCSASA